MRIIAGKFRGRKLNGPSSLEARPTSDRLRETLFNVIAPRINNARVLDLCAGSGAIGIEALSRGARQTTFVDRSRQMCAVVKSNLELCRVELNQSEVVQAEAHDYLRRVAARGALAQPFDLVFFDPPYAGDYLSVLETLGSDTTLLTETALLIVEHHHKTELPETIGRLNCYRVLKQGESALSFYETTRNGGSVSR